MRKFSTLIFSLALSVVACGSAHAQRITVTIAGNGAPGYTGDGSTGLYAALNGPTDVCPDAAGNVYVADNGNNSIRKIAATTGVITTVESTITPYYMCMDATTSNLYFSTTGAIKKMNLSSGVITTVAGTGIAGYSGDGGPATAAMIQGQLGLCLDAAGNLYIADGVNNRVRVVAAATGIINTIAGTGVSGYTGDGGSCLSATLGVPLFVCVNAAGDVYIADQGEGYSGGVTSYVSTNAMVIRKINGTTGVITTFAGSMTSSDVTGVLAINAWLGSITGMCLDAAGNLYCCEESCSCRKIDITTDSINYVGGNFGIDAFLDNLNSLNSWMDEPHGLFIDGSQRVVVADYNNNRVRKLIQLSSTPSFAYGAGQSINACSGAAFSIDTQMAITNNILGEVETFTVLTAPANGALSGFPYTAHSKGTDSLTTTNGLYYTATAGYTGNDSFKVMVSNGATSDVITIYVSVSTASPGAISGSTAICMGSATLFTESIPGGAWSASYGYASVDSFGNVTGLSVGVDTIYYTVTIAYGCTLTATSLITIDGTPNAGSITGSNNINAGGSTTLSNVSATGSGVWSTTNTSVSTVTGAGLVYGVAPGTDSIVYSVTNSCGTANTYFSFTVSEVTTGVSNTSASADKLVVMPNPAKDNFTVTVSSSKNEQVTVTITSITGAKLKEFTGATNQPIDASLNMPAGIYLLNAATATNSMSGKIVIE